MYIDLTTIFMYILCKHSHVFKQKEIFFYNLIKATREIWISCIKKNG